MKPKIKLIIICLSSTIVIQSNINAQVSTGTNNGNPSTNYCGWDNLTNGSLMIKNESNNPINFLTNTGAGGTTPIRMTIQGSGNIGIGTTNPNYLLHQNRAGNNATYHQFTNTNIGTTSTDGFLIGITAGGIAEFRQQEALSMRFFTNDGSASIKERMRIG